MKKIFGLIVEYCGSLILGIASVGLVCFGVMATYQVAGHDASISSMIVIGASLLVVAVMLPRIADEIEVGPKGVKAKLKALGDSVQAAETKVPTTTTTTTITAEAVSEEKSETDDVISQILADASRSPHSAFIRLAIEIERKWRILLAKTNWQNPRYARSFLASVNYVEDRKYTSIALTSSLRAFWELRSSIVHGVKSINDDDLLRAIDSGIMIIKMIDSIPHETNTVISSTIKLYEDRALTKERKSVKGLLLDSESPAGVLHHKRIYPTTQTYKKGQQLSWEWNFENIYGESWYADPDTNEVLMAWISSAEFIGRPLEEV